LAPLAEWVKGAGSEAEVGILAQQVLGRLFQNDFTATPESWAAAQVLVAAPRSSNLAKMWWWFMTGKVRRAKGVLAKMVGDDLSAVNAIGIAVHNLAKSLRQMRSLYARFKEGTLSRSGCREVLTRTRQRLSAVRRKGHSQRHCFPQKFVIRFGNRHCQPTRSRAVSRIHGGELEQVSRWSDAKRSASPRRKISKVGSGISA
jgi:hypothetical protein